MLYAIKSGQFKGVNVLTHPKLYLHGRSLLRCFKIVSTAVLHCNDTAVKCVVLKLLMTYCSVDENVKMEQTETDAAAAGGGVVTEDAG